MNKLSLLALKTNKQNIEHFFNTKPELAFIVSVLSKQKNTINSNSSLNQKEFIRLIRHHRLNSIFYKAIQEQNITLPKELRIKLEKINTNNKMHMMKLTAELIRIHKLFTDNDIEYISLKGPALSQQLYGDYTIRSSRDLDILVNITDFVKARNLLKSIGYKNNKNFNTINKFNYKEFEFIHEKKHIIIELHHRLFNNKYLLPVDKRTFEQKKTITINNSTIFILNDFINFEYIALHAMIHNWKRLHWPLDVILLKNKMKFIKVNKDFVSLKETLNYNLQDYSFHGSEKNIQLISKTLHLLRLRKSYRYKYQEILQRLFIPYRFFDNLIR